MLIFIVIIIFIIGTSVLVILLSRRAGETMQQLSLEAFKEKMAEGWTVVDVRTVQEYNDGKIEGARCIDFYGSDFKSQIEKLDKNGKYLLYCRSGGRSARARKTMQAMGFEHVADLAGGYKGIGD